MDRKIQISILAVLLAVAPFSIASAGPPALSGKQSPAAVIEASVNKTPKAVFPQTRFEFDPVFEGVEIIHDFVVENKGAAPLIISRIRPD